MQRLAFSFYLGVCAIMSIVQDANASAEGVVKKQIESYLNNLETFQARFRQYSSGHTMAEGSFYLNRPRQFLWQYDEPYPQKIVSTGSRLFYHDPVHKQVTQLPLNSGPASILTRKKFVIGETDDYSSVISGMDKESIRVTFSPKSVLESIEGMVVELIFERNPLLLAQMVSENEMGEKVYVLFSNQESGQKIDESLFKFVPPQEEWELED